MFLFGYLEMGILIIVGFVLYVIYKIIMYFIELDKRKKENIKQKQILDEFNKKYSIEKVDAYISECIDEENSKEELYIKICNNKPKPKDVRYKIDDYPRQSRSANTEPSIEEVYLELKEEYLNRNTFKSFTFEKSISFYECLSKHLNSKCMSEPDLYNAAGVSRQTFYKIKYEEGYIPRRRTVFYFILILQLDSLQANELLSLAGYQFNPTSNVEQYIKYCIENGLYNIDEINEYLYDNFDDVL